MQSAPGVRGGAREPVERGRPAGLVVPTPDNRRVAMGLRVFFLGLGYCAEALIGGRPVGRAKRNGAVGRAGGRRFALPASTPTSSRAADRSWTRGGAEPRRGDRRLDSAERRGGAGSTYSPPRSPPRRTSPASSYFSTVGVYGEHGGRWVDETAATRTRSERGLARLADEARWTEAGRARGAAVDILRLPGIYGPGRNALERLRAGRGAPDRQAGASHQPRPCRRHRRGRRGSSLRRASPGQIWNVADDEPAPPQDVIAYAAALLGVPPPPEEPFDAAPLSPMAASFFAEERRVRNAKAKALLGFSPAYPSYREGLRALREAGEGRA